MRSETKGYALALVSAACLGSTGVIARFAYRFEPDPVTLALYRNVISVAAVLPPLALVAPSRLRIRGLHVPLFAGLALTGFALNSLAYLQAVRYTSVAMAAILINLYPALVVIGATLFFGESPRGKGRALLLTLVGAALLMQLFDRHNFRANLPGISWGLVSAGAAAGNVLLAKRATATYAVSTIVAHSAWIGCLWLLLFRGPRLPAPPRYPAQAWLWFVGLGLGPSVGGHFAKTQALKYIEAGRASLVGTAEVLIAAGWGALVFGEGFSAGQAVGAILVLLGLRLVRQP